MKGRWLADMQKITTDTIFISRILQEDHLAKQINVTYAL